MSEVMIEEKPIHRFKISFNTCCLCNIQMDALEQILQLLVMDAGLNNGDTLLTVLTMMEFHKIEHLTLECDQYSYNLKIA